MNGFCENDMRDVATNVCDACYGEYCPDCLVELKTRKHPLCKECAIIISGVRGKTKPPQLGDKKTANQRRKHLSERPIPKQIVDEIVFDSSLSDVQKSSSNQSVNINSAEHQLEQVKKNGYIEEPRLANESAADQLESIRNSTIGTYQTKPENRPRYQPIQPEQIQENQQQVIKEPQQTEDNSNPSELVEYVPTSEPNHRQVNSDLDKKFEQVDISHLRKGRRAFNNQADLETENISQTPATQIVSPIQSPQSPAHNVQEVNQGQATNVRRRRRRTNERRSSVTQKNPEQEVQPNKDDWDRPVLSNTAREDSHQLPRRRRE